MLFVEDRPRVKAQVAGAVDRQADSRRRVDVRVHDGSEVHVGADRKLAQAPLAALLPVERRGGELAAAGGIECDAGPRIERIGVTPRQRARYGERARVDVERSQIGDVGRHGGDDVGREHVNRNGGRFWACHSHSRSIRGAVGSIGRSPGRAENNTAAADGCGVVGRRLKRARRGGAVEKDEQRRAEGRKGRRAVVDRLLPIAIVVDLARVGCGAAPPDSVVVVGVELNIRIELACAIDNVVGVNAVELEVDVAGIDARSQGGGRQHPCVEQLDALPRLPRPGPSDDDQAVVIAGGDIALDEKPALQVVAAGRVAALGFLALDRSQVIVALPGKAHAVRLGRRQILEEQLDVCAVGQLVGIDQHRRQHDVVDAGDRHHLELHHRDALAGTGDVDGAGPFHAGDRLGGRAVGVGVEEISPDGVPGLDGGDEAGGIARERQGDGDLSA